jgi:hypothetical protein
MIIFLRITQYNTDILNAHFHLYEHTKPADHEIHEAIIGVFTEKNTSIHVKSKTQIIRVCLVPLAKF